MATLLENYLNQFLTFVLVLTRLSGLILSAPLFGARGAPMRVRAALAIGLSLVIAPIYWNTPLPSPGNLVILGVIVAREALLGVALGVAVMLILSSLQISGQIISQMGGMSLAEVFDPGFETNVPILSQLLDLTATAIFFAIDGHRLVLESMLDSFHWMPPGSCQFTGNLFEALTEVTTQSFSIGIRAAAPVMEALMLAVVITGVISRALPQLNIVSIGFNINALVFFGVTAVAVGGLAWILQEEGIRLVQLVHESLR